MTFTTKLTLITLLLLTTGLFPATAQDKSAAGMDAFVNQALKDYNVPGAVVAIIKDGKIVSVKGYGFGDVDAQSKIDGDTLFQLASISKSFTALAFAAQATQGKADWEKPVREELPGFKMMSECATSLATPKDMLVHRSGLRKFEGDLIESVGFDRAQVLERVRYFQPAYTFRDHPEYNNIGFFIAGEVTAKLAGKKWEDALAELVLTPYGMKRTGLAEAMIPDEKNVANPYAMVAGKRTKIPHRMQATLAPAGGVASTGHDMAIFAEKLLNGGGGIVDEENLDIMFEPVIAEKPGFTDMAPISGNTGFAYSPGWGVYHYSTNKILEKGGALDGFRTLITLVPEKKLGIVTLCNMNLTALPEAVRAKVLAEELGGPNEAWQKEILDANNKIAAMFKTPEPPKDAKPAPLSLEKYAGTYSSPLYGDWVLTYVPADKTMKLSAGPAKLQGSVKPWDGNSFFLKWKDNYQSIGADLDFNVENGTVTGLQYEDRYEFKKTK